MSKTFFPRLYKLVPASEPHPPNTHYKVSLGFEDWQGSHIEVVKVQMMYDGVVSGRRSPSYPIGTDDYTRVTKVIKELIDEQDIVI